MRSVCEPPDGRLSFASVLPSVAGWRHATSRDNERSVLFLLRLAFQTQCNKRPSFQVLVLRWIFEVNDAQPRVILQITNKAAIYRLITYTVPIMRTVARTLLQRTVASTSASAGGGGRTVGRTTTTRTRTASSLPTTSLFHQQNQDEQQRTNGFQFKMNNASCAYFYSTTTPIQMSTTSNNNNLVQPILSLICDYDEDDDGT